MNGCCMSLYIQRMPNNDVIETKQWTSDYNWAKSNKIVSSSDCDDFNDYYCPRKKRESVA